MFSHLQDFYKLDANVSIRVDRATRKASAIDVVMLVSSKNSTRACEVIKRMPAEFLRKMDKIRINGKGRETWVADAPVLVELIWQLPGKASKAFRGQWVNYISRILAGDRKMGRVLTDIADERDNTTTITTTTVVPNGALPTHEVANIHRTLANQQMEELRSSGSKRPRTHLLSTVTEQKSKKARLVRSEYITEAVDLAWNALKLNKEDEGEKYGCVYFVRMRDTEFVKVGQTTSICARMASLQVSCPTPLDLEFQLATPNYKCIERKLHAYLKGQDLHVRGEWFKLQKDTASYLKVLQNANVVD